MDPRTTQTTNTDDRRDQPREYRQGDQQDAGQRKRRSAYRGPAGPRRSGTSSPAIRAAASGGPEGEHPEQQPERQGQLRVEQREAYSTRVIVS